MKSLEGVAFDMRYKNAWVLLVMILAGVVLGGFIGQATQEISWLSWLNFGQIGRAHV